jgi:hypothetical protein
MTTKYQPLPTVEHLPGESILNHGGRVLLFVAETGITATLETESLEQAYYAANYVVRSVDMHEPIREKLATALREIARTIKQRTLENNSILARMEAESKPPKPVDRGAVVDATPIIPIRPSPSIADPL